ncbi:CHAT domain-containing protein [Tenacibaculum sp. MEBiC06402]|uniref:CHAT domain-containing protein n=1 Tax=unclassified Tenacibaculum TaxID=2635139 RepID=UPI003B9B66F0
MLFYIYSFQAQEISKQFDSILALPGKNVDKIQAYSQLLKKWEEKKNYKQLGDDAHELAKKIYKEDIDKAIFYNKVGINAKEKVIPLDTCSLKTSFYNVGFYNKRKKNFKEAIEGYKKALTFNDCKDFDRKSRKYLTVCYNAIANDYFNNEDYFYAVSNYEKAIEFVDNSQTTILIDLYIKAGTSYKSLRSKKSGKKALEYFFKAEALYSLLPNYKEADKFGIYYTIAGQYFQNGDDIEKSFEYYDKALELVDKVAATDDLKRFYFNLGYTYQKYDEEKSKKYYKKSLEYQVEDDEFRKKTFFGLGENASIHGDYDNAQNYFLKSLSFVLGESITKEPEHISTESLTQIQDKGFLLELFRTQMENWDRMMLKKSDDFISNQIIKKAKQSDELINLMLRDDLSSNSKLLLRDLASEVYILALEACYRINAVKDAFYFIEKNKALLLIRDIRKEKAASKDSLIDKKTYFSNPEFSKIITPDEVKLSNDQVVINYIMAERLVGKIPNAYGLYLSNNYMELFKIEKVDKLISNITELRNKLDKPFETEKDKSEYLKVANTTYNLLIPERIQGKIQGKKITILADHIISFVPFEALIPNAEKFEYLVSLNEINYDYSLTFREENSKTKFNASKNYLGIAPVDFSDRLISLKNTEKEIELGESYYSGKLLIGEDATASNFKKIASNYKILHLATHANASDTINPWIAFRNSKFKLSQFDSLKTKADLVVLSACNTSLGQIVRGEGVMSLARGFFASGSKTVIPSLWEVNDKSTTSITSKFYESLSNGASKSEALRKAKLSYLVNNKDAEASPYYWASLIIIGDNSTLEPQIEYTFYLKILLFFVFLLLLVFMWYKKK